MQIKSFAAGDEDAGNRLDVFISSAADLTRSHVQKLIGEELVTVNGRKERSSYRMKPGDLISLQIPMPAGTEIKPEFIPLEIYYEDTDVIIVNKPRGMVVHPAPGNYSGTLVNALLHHCRHLSTIGGNLRPGIVHRLDKDTSGLIIAAKNDMAHLGLTLQLKDRLIERRYLALVHGRVRDRSGIIDAPIGRDPKNRQKMAVTIGNGKDAVTKYHVLGRYIGHTYLELKLVTGRTHQIRVHLSFIGHPVVGDPKYGPIRPRFGLEGQFLHAAALGFNHPRTGRYLGYEAPLPVALTKLSQDLAPENPG